EGADPFSRRDGLRAYGVATRRFEVEVAGERLSATLSMGRHGALELAVGDVQGPLSFEPIGASEAGAGARFDLQFAGRRDTVQTWTRGETVHVFCARGATSLVEVDLLEHAGEGEAEGGRLSAPMPGKVVSFAVKAGDAVKKGQALAVMEAMKMEHTIASPADGTVAELLYAPGDQVAEGAELLKLSGA